MYGDESDGAEQTKPEAEPPVTCKGLELMKVNKTATQGFNISSLLAVYSRL